MRIAALILLTLTTTAHAETVYRCPGSSYQSAPCKGGEALQIDLQANVLPAVDTTAYVPRYVAPVSRSGPYVAGIRESDYRAHFDGPTPPPVFHWPGYFGPPIPVTVVGPRRHFSHPMTVGVQNGGTARGRTVWNPHR